MTVKRFLACLESCENLADKYGFDDMALYTYLREYRGIKGDDARLVIDMVRTHMKIDK